MGMNVGGRRLTTGDIVLGAALLIGLISVFLPWYSASFNCGGASYCAGLNTSLSVGALSYWSGWIFLLAVLAGIVLYVLRTFVPSVNMPALPQTDAVIFMIIGGVMLLMAILWLLLGSGAGYSGPGYSAGPSFGLFIGIIAAVAVIVGGFLKRAAGPVAPQRLGGATPGAFGGGAGSYGGGAGATTSTPPPPASGTSYGGPGGTPPPPPAGV